MEQVIIDAIAELRLAQCEIDAKYRAISFLTGMNRNEIDELGGF